MVVGGVLRIHCSHHIINLGLMKDTDSVIDPGAHSHR